MKQVNNKSIHLESINLAVKETLTSKEIEYNGKEGHNTPLQTYDYTS